MPCSGFVGNGQGSLEEERRRGGGEEEDEQEEEEEEEEKEEEERRRRTRPILFHHGKTDGRDQAEATWALLTELTGLS